MPLPFIIAGLAGLKAAIGTAAAVIGSSAVATTAAKIAVGVAVATLTYEVSKLTLSKLEDMIKYDIQVKNIKATSAMVDKLHKTNEYNEADIGLLNSKNEVVAKIHIKAEELSDEIYEGKILSLVS